ncbi:CcdC protein domain-containing protein [Nocardia panacis]|uniref:CcdC protein domain-containing protein n=1 Tax=Nocardia panacis TaxID=2340916 RepID=UPI001939573E|nr:CcdC protein domain-containing protein [Nocardia panacis]
MSSTLTFVVVAALVIGVIVKRFIGEPLNARDTLIPPVVLLGIGVYSLTKVHDISAVDVLWLVLGCAAGLAFGAVRGTTIRLSDRDGHLWQRYSPWTLVVWVVSTSVGLGIGYAAHYFGVHPDARPITLSIGVSLLGEATTLTLRALRTGIPFAPERDRASGTSLDDLRTRLRR